ncbi:ammonium transporter [Roseovarius indicus]|uniref:Ammonia transporter n=2 Tax=Roseovarius indicus TaxID=540747 RepID=A0A0T5P3P7_9RHOB|nr:ammonium transporter [Roseovarius indicus]KRS15897.1 ammonium transporter [Roseovarius indicus]OAO06200.1 ammonium transporter [Roseovarius indicus]QEW26375.1 Ammonia transporter [Roseovarius indicus]SFE64118.1 ammonium transporter (TC 1.A.11) [Roseovarius indicus]
MEEQLAELAAQVAALEAKGNLTNTMFAETYYYLTIPLMIIIHAGFLAYEMGASRAKNALSSGVKNILAFAFVIPAFYFFGWWVYWAFPTGFSLSAGPNGISGAEYANGFALAWGDAAAYMGPNTEDQIDGVFWGAFTLFAATTASIFSGAVIERIQTVGFVILAIVLGGFSWTLAAAWGWHSDGWLIQQWGVHDFGAAGLVHAVAAFFALGVLINLGPRIGKFNEDGTANNLAGHNMPFTATGLMLIVVGFWGFLMGCLVVGGESWSWGGNFTTIYGTPTNLGALSFNILMGVAGGIIGAWTLTRDPFWMMSGALAGLISVASGVDIYFPSLTFIIAMAAGLMLKPAAAFIESFGIDDAVGAVTVHGVMGVFGMLVLGIFASGYPALLGEGVPTVSFIGQLVGTVVFVAIGFITGYGCSLILKMVGMLRVPEAAEIAGLDTVKVPAQAYPEGIMASPPASK